MYPHNPTGIVDFILYIPSTFMDLNFFMNRRFIISTLSFIILFLLIFAQIGLADYPDG